MAPMIGMMMSPTSEVTMAPNAAPMTTPTARSTTLPFIANSRNSLSIVHPLSRGVGGSATEHRLDALERLHVLLQRVQVGLHVADRRAELACRAERAALFTGRV